MTDIKVPSPGESISEVEIGSWLVTNGSWVEKDQEIVSMESEKASLTVSAPESGQLEILVAQGERIAVGSVIARLDTSAQKPEIQTSAPIKNQPPSGNTPAGHAEVADPKAAEMPAQTGPQKQETYPAVKVTPVARQIMAEHHLSVEDIINGLRRITRDEVNRVLKTKADGESAAVAVEPPSHPEERKETRTRMSLLREKLSQRLVAVKNETAMLTTFNEIDLSAVMDLRNRYKAGFEEKYGTKLGFMSFFTLAATRALIAFPQVNSRIEGNEMVSFHYTDIGIAVQTPKGLMVPILRNTQSMGLGDIELRIADLARKARENRISLDDLEGGTFSITNGGIFGSLLSTPILNPPQAAILGMHNIVDRPVAIDNQVVIRPMMYVALSYDHRLVDGKDSVGFLKTVKELIENPVKMLDARGQAEKSLLGL